MKVFLKYCLTNVLLILAFYFSPLFIYNLVVDPWGLMGTKRKFESVEEEPNQRTLKNRFIRTNSLPDTLSLVLSDSRGGVIDMKKTSFYNYSYSSGDPSEFYQDLLNIYKYKHIDTLILMLDEHVFIHPSAVEDHNKQALRKNFDGGLDFLKYAFMLPSSIKINKKKSLINEKQIKFDIYMTGLYKEYNFQNQSVIDTIVELDMNDSIHFLNNKLNFRLKDQLININKLISLCKQNGTMCYVFLHPIAEDNFNRNKEKCICLLNLMGRIETMNKSSKLIILNNWHFRETKGTISHYTKDVGDIIVSNMRK